MISRKPRGAPGKFLLAEVRNRRRRGKFRDMREVSRNSWIDRFELRPRLCVSDQNDGRRERNRIGLDGNARSALRCNFLAQHRCAQRQPGLRIGGELPGFDDDESGTGAHQLAGQQRRATRCVASDFADEIGR